MAQDVEMVPQDESVSGVISASTQEVGMEALPSGAGLDPVSAVGVAESFEREVECSFSKASVLSAPTLPVFQTGEETSSRSEQCSPATQPQQFFSNEQHGGPTRAILQCFAGQARVAGIQ